MSTSTYLNIPRKQTTFIPATRHQQSLVAAAEKRSLIWLAERTPRWINSDHLTVLGFTSQIMAGACYALARWNRYALVGFAVQSLPVLPSLTSSNCVISIVPGAGKIPRRLSDPEKLQGSFDSARTSFREILLRSGEHRVVENDPE
jgi:hypothetical protein